MTENHGPEQAQPKSLHDVVPLQRVEVRQDLFLRPLEAIDARDILEILDADPTIRSRVSVASKMHSPADVAAQVENYQQDGNLVRYAIVQGDKAIGLASLWRDIDNPFDLPDNPDDYGFGYFLDPDMRGNGIVTAAIQRLMDVTAENLYVRQFIAFCEDDNPDSIAVLEKLGFQATDITPTEEANGWQERKYIREVS